MEGGETLVEETLTAGDGVGDATRGFELEVEAVEVAVKAAVSASGSGSRSAAAAGPPSTERAARQMEDLLARYPALPATPNNMRAVASLPSNIPGPFSLSVSFRDESGPRNPAWVFSEALQQLFVGMDSVVPLEIRTTGDVPAGAQLRFLLRFQEAKYSNLPVPRCPAHLESDPDPAKRSHLVRCTNEHAHYNYDTGSPSITVPLDNTKSYTAELLKFTCLTSCPGGPNRRNLELVTILEFGDVVLGCRVFAVRICACPVRDIRLVEKKVAKRQEQAAAGDGTGGSGGRGKGKKARAAEAEAAAAAATAAAAAAAQAPLADGSAASAAESAVCTIAPSAEDTHDCPPAESDTSKYLLQVRGETNYCIVKEIVRGLEHLQKRSSKRLAQPEYILRPHEDAHIAQSSGAGGGASSKKRKAAAAPAKSAKKARRSGDDADDDDDDGDDLAGDTEPEDSDSDDADAQGGLSMDKEVQQWLASIGLGQYADAFKKLGYDDLDVISNLNELDLNFLSVQPVGHRKKLLIGAQRLARLRDGPQIDDGAGFPALRLRKSIRVARQKLALSSSRISPAEAAAAQAAAIGEPAPAQANS